MAHRTRSMRSWFVVLILVALSPALEVRGQGTQGTLPDPISTRELNGYADRLSLSDQQRQALESMHDTYKSEFRVLREGDIAEFLKEMRGLNSGGVMPKREAVDAFMKKMEQAAKKIAAIDSRLFDQVQTILTPEQQSRLPRVRQARQRARYAAAQLMMMSGQQIVDLSAIFQHIDLAPDQFAVADQLMSQYESKLTSNMGKLYESSTGMMSDLFDEIEKSGLADADVNDPQTQQKMMEVMQAAWQRIIQKSLEISNETADLNRRTCQSLVAVMPEESGRLFRAAFHRKAYPEVSFAYTVVGAALHAAANSEELPQEQRQSAAAALSQYHSSMEKLVEDTIAMLDESRRNFSPWDFNSESMKDRTRQLTETQQKAVELNAQAQAALDSLGPDLKRKFTLAAQSSIERNMSSDEAQLLVQSIDDEIEEDLEEDEDDAEPEEGSVAELAEAQEMAAMAIGDRFVPAAIDQRQLLASMGRLELTDEQRSVLNELHEGYLEKFQAIRDTQIAKIIELQQSMWSYDESTQTTTGPTIQKIDECYRLRRTATEAIQALDRTFFDDVEVAVLTAQQQPRMASVRLARERACCSGAAAGMWFGAGSNESSIDLVTLVQQVQMKPQQLAMIDAILSEYETSGTPLFRDRFSASLEMQRLQEHWQVMVQEAQEKEGGITSVAYKFREVLGPAYKRTSEANAAANKLNTETLTKLEAALPPDAAFALREAYNKQAFPNVYLDGGSVLAKLQQAGGLPDLSEEQRQKIHDLRAEYQPAYEELSLRMVQASNGLDSMNFLDEDENAALDWQEKQEQISRLQFDRTELNARAAGKLKTILNQEQLKVIGGLPEHDQG